MLFRFSGQTISMYNIDNMPIIKQVINPCNAEINNKNYNKNDNKREVSFNVGVM